MEPVTLRTERLLLRPFEPADAAAVYRAYQDPDIPRWTPAPSPYTREHAEEFVRRCPNAWRENTSYPLAVVTQEEGTLVGAMFLVRLATLSTPERQAELGYWTAKEHRGRGFTAEAAGAVVDWAFTELGVERMEWYAEVGNAASRAVALRLGFRIEGVMRARIAYQGTRRDAWVGALLPSDRGLPSPTPYLPAPDRLR